MNFLKKLFAQKASRKSGWNIKPLEERPAARTKAAEPTTNLNRQPEADEPVATEPQFLTDAFNKFEIVDDSTEQVDPYSTHRWDMSSDDQERKLKSQQTDKRPKEKATELSNPYDTSVSRGGWKK